MHRQLLGLRWGDLRMLAGGTSDRVDGPLCELELPGVVAGEVRSITTLPHALLEDQEAALDAMERALDEHRAQAIGLGSLLAVVAGRGAGLAERVSAPVTTGAAATTWAALGNTRAVAEHLGLRQVAVLGFTGTVGRAVAEQLASEGFKVVAGGHGKAAERQARKLGIELLPDVEAVRDQPLVIGAATTGGTLDPSALSPGAVMLDVALPPTLRPGPLPPGVQVLAGEAITRAPGLRRGFWGRPYQVFAGYGPWQLYACLAEPMVMAAIGRVEPYAQGRRLKAGAVQDFGAAATALGFRPRLAQGWVSARLPAPKAQLSAR